MCQFTSLHNGSHRSSRSDCIRGHDSVQQGSLPAACRIFRQGRPIELEVHTDRNTGNGTRWNTNDTPVLGKAGKVAGVAGAVVDGGITAYDTYQIDTEQHPEWSEGHKVARAGVKGTVTGGATWAGAWLGAKGGAAIGAAVSGPFAPVGAVVGGLVGGVIGGVAGHYFGEMTGDAINNATLN